MGCECSVQTSSKANGNALIDINYPDNNLIVTDYTDCHMQMILHTNLHTNLHTIRLTVIDISVFKI